MVAMVSGSGFGLMNGSAGVLGQQGLFGSATFGTAKEGVYLNVFNGNLTLQNTTTSWPPAASTSPSPAPIMPKARSTTATAPTG